MAPTDAPAPEVRRRERLPWCLLVFAVAFAARLIHLGQLRGSPLLEIVMGDGRSYDRWARGLAAGDWLGSDVFYQAPLYAYFLGVLYATIGDDTLGVRVVQSAIGAGSCVVMALAGWRLFSKPAGIAAGLLLALYPPAIFADVTLQKSVLVIFLLCVSLWILAGIARDPRTEPRPGPSIALGAAIGALVLARENALVFVPVLIPWLFWASHARGARRLVPAAMFAIGLAAVLLPVALRNLYVGGELHLTTSQLGPNLYIGNRPGADGSYAPLVPDRGDPRYERADATALAEQALGRELTPSEVSRYFVGRVVERVREEPLDWLALLGRKLALAWNAVEVVDTEDLYTHADASLLLRLLAAVFHFGVLAPLALLGLWLAREERRRLLPLYAMLAAYLASLVAFYVFGRYRLPLAVLLVPFAGVACVRLPRLKREGARGVAIAGAITALAAVLCNWPLLDPDYMRSVTHYNLGNELFATDLDAAEHHYREAIRRHPGNARAQNNLGVVFASRGELDSAQARYEEALRLYPGNVDARVNLARTLRERGDLLAAARHYSEAIRLAPGRLDAHQELGETYAELGQEELARESLERARMLRAGRRGS